MIKNSINQENITLVSIYASNIGAPKYIKQILIYLKGETESNTIIKGETSIPHFQQWIDHPDRESIRKH